MRRRATLVFAIAVSLTLPLQSLNAVPAINKAGAKLAVVNIQKLISKTTANLQNLGENSIVGNSRIAQKYNQLLAPIAAKYLIDKNSSELRVNTALIDLDRVSNFVIQWDNYEACNGKCIKGSVYKFPFNSKDENAQSQFDRSVLIGIITPQDKSGYDRARETYKIAVQESVRIDDAFGAAGYALGVMIFDEYDAEEEKLRNSLEVLKLLLIAAKRASLASRDFESNFKTAFYFQYNLDALYLVGNSSFSQIESYLDALNVVSASQAYALGAGISRNYQSSKAASFNKGLVNAFTNDAKFRSMYSQALSLYRSSSKQVNYLLASNSSVSRISSFIEST